MQKMNHDHHRRSRQYFVGQKVSVRKFRIGPIWSVGIIVERSGPLTYLVQVTLGVFWRRHVERLRPINDQANLRDESDSATTSQLELSAPSDFVPVWSIRSHNL